MPKKVKLFGFELTMTSALLLFIFTIPLILGGTFGLYTVIQVYNNTDYLAPMYLIVYSTMLIIGLYILVKTLQFKNKS